VRLHRVERTQHAVQAREDAHALLRERERLGIERTGAEAVVDVAVEREPAGRWACGFGAARYAA
jgi:hypothetical protein